MNENLNLVEILKDCPEGTELYSPIIGEVVFKRIKDCEYPIVTYRKNGNRILSLLKMDYFSQKEYKENVLCFFPAKSTRLV